MKESIKEDQMDEVTKFLGKFHESCVSSVSLIDSIMFLNYNNKDVQYSVKNLQSILKKYSMLMNDLILKMDDPKKAKEIKGIIYESMQHLESENFEQSKELLDIVAGKVYTLRQELAS